MDDNIYNNYKKNTGNKKEEPIKHFKFTEEMGEYYNIRQFILKKNVNVRMFLVLSLKQITWYKELKIKFDIHPSHITEFFDYMKENDMILFSPLVEVDGILFETVTSQNNAHFYGARDLVKVYTLTEKGKEIAKRLTDDIIKLTNQRSDLNMYLQQILKKTNIHRILMNKIKGEESKRGLRKVRTPDGSEYYHETKNQIKFEKELNQAIIDTKQELLLEKQTNNQLTTKEAGELALIKNGGLAVYEENNRQKPKPIKYDGVYSHLSQSQIEGIMDGSLFYDEETGKVLETNEKTIEKNYDLKTSQRYKELEDEKVLSVTGKEIEYKLTEEGAEHYLGKPRPKQPTNKDDGMDFINNLSAGL